LVNEVAKTAVSGLPASTGAQPEIIAQKARNGEE
jgi:hypothetical protein